jgi:regulatory subunit for Cdc7p protein kinase
VVEEDSFVTANTILAKAQEFGIKIWSVTKLESVIERCLTPVEREEPPHPLDHGHVHPPTRTLSTLLAQEKVHGTTERDPSQRRHDYRYFSKGAYFVLVEDIKQELATLVAAEYMPSRGRDGRERRTWPELFCHPKARGPFIEFDDREQRRWERQERAAQQKAQAEEQAEARRAMARAQSRARAELEAKKNGDLRRSVSMVNLQRHASGPDSVFQVPVADDPGDLDESAHASGFLASGAYLAASGNSFSVTSTTGTTSAADFSHRSLPTGLRGKLQHEVLIKRRASGMIDAEHSQATGSAMAPPADIPERRRAMLRKARSTNTLKLPPKAEATVRPGYCESCRVKFQDFPQVTSFSRQFLSLLIHFRVACQKRQAPQIRSQRRELCPT